MVDRDLTRALLERAQGFRERAPVYPIEPVPVELQLRRARLLADLLWEISGECAPRLTTSASAAVARMLLPDNGRVNVYLASGAIDASI